MIPVSTFGTFWLNVLGFNETYFIFREDLSLGPSVVRKEHGAFVIWVKDPLDNKGQFQYNDIGELIRL